MVTTILIAIASFSFGCFVIYRKDWFLSTLTRSLVQVADRLGNREGETKPLSSYLSDDVVADIISEYEIRSRGWENFATWSFSFALLSIVIGILIFVFAERIVLNSPDLPLLLQQKTQLKEEIFEAELRFSDSAAESKWAPLIFSNWNEIEGLLRAVTNVTGQLKSRGSEEDATKMAFNQFKNLNSKHESHYKPILTSLGLFQSEGSSSIPPSGLKKLEQVFLDNKLQPDLLSTLIDRWFAFFEDYLRAFEDKSKEQLNEAISNGITLLEETTSVLVKVQNIKSSLADAKTKADAKHMANLSFEERSQFQRKKQNLSDLEDEIAEIRQDFNPNNLYSAIPLLVVRIGAIVLLIFLTQILLASYRYNTMLSTYYSAITDALRMSPMDEESKKLRIEEFVSLLGKLYPQHASYSIPDPPTNQIAEMAKR